jgi:hypothetical protein
MRLDAWSVVGTEVSGFLLQSTIRRSVISSTNSQPCNESKVPLIIDVLVAVPLHLFFVLGTASSQQPAANSQQGEASAD